MALSVRRICSGFRVKLGISALLLFSMIVIRYHLQKHITPASFVRTYFARHPHKEDVHGTSLSLGQHLHGKEEQNVENEDTVFYGSRTSISKDSDEKIAAFSQIVLDYEEMSDQCHSQPGFSHPESWSQYDLMKKGPFQFLSDYRNPCWRLHQSQELQCLPYFYLAGFPKCGTTDMFERLSRHPYMTETPKEMHWLTRTRLQGSTLEHLASFYANQLTKKNDTHAIVGDGSASTAWDNNHWTFFPGNEGCSEPRVINADYVRHLFPDVKIIFMLRDPTSRLYSEYLFFKHRNKTQNNFHILVQESINAFKACRKLHSLRTCAYNSSLYSVRLHVGLYSVYLEDWLLRFPRDQLFFSRLEDVKSGETIVPKIFKFLDLYIPDNEIMRTILTLRRQNVGKLYGPIWNETRAALDAFYRPFNARLAHILQDQRFTWQDVHH